MIAKMTPQEIILALGLPDGCRVDQRVPKKLLLENGAPTAADKRLINENIKEIHWVAALKPNTIGVLNYCDDLREYLEIAVLTVMLRTTEAKLTNAVRLSELVHRAVPYPLFLLMFTEQRLTLSVAHKRWAQNDAAKVVLDGGVVLASLPDDVPSADTFNAFTQSLSLTSQPQTTLFSLYQGWGNSVHALLAAKLTGIFKTARSPEEATARHKALQEYQRLELQLSRLRVLANKEKQLARQVEFNLALKRAQVQLALVRRQL